MRILCTGMAGFLGSHVCEHLLKTTDWDLVSLDRLDCSGNLNRLTDIDCWDQQKQRCTILWHDLKSAISESLAARIGPIDVIIHLAASTHVDRSITDPMSFVMDNVVGTGNLLDYARTLTGLQRLIYFSTDEVMGPSDGHFYREWDRHKAANPYAATKSGAEQLCWAYYNTYKLPVFVARGMNLVGQRQHLEKFIPATIKKVLAGDEVIIHADPTCTMPGARSYIHARNVSAAIIFLLEHASDGEAYHVVGEREINNLEMAEMISRQLNIPLRFRLVDFHSSRPGHDLVYRLDGSRMKAMGWQIPVPFEDSLRQTIKWYLEHPEWLA